MNNFPKTYWLWTECLALCVGLPMLFVVALPTRMLFGVLWMVALYALWLLIRRYGLGIKQLWRSEALTRANLRPILLRLALSAAAMTLFTLLFEPQRFLGLMRERTEIWAIVMVFYPLLSVVSQEIIFRSFFFERYAPLFSSTQRIVVASALAFGFAHVIFGNWIAPLMCLVGGYFFSDTYAKTRSLALVWLEHSIYGCFVFTVGLGWYFYHGSVQAVGG